MHGRKDERFEATLPVRLEDGEGVVRNVSANGIYFVTDVALQADVALKQGAPVKLTLEFQSFPGGPIQVECIARIVRVDEQGEKRGVAARINSFEFFRVRKPEEQRY
jgi:hypothetical protein